MKVLRMMKFGNNLIIEDVIKAVGDGRTPIVLTNRKSHVALLVERLSLNIKHVVTLTGEGSSREKREALQRLQDIPSEEPLVIAATGKYVGEGFDYPRLDTLFLALPISWKGLVAQYVGRLHREYDGKRDVRIYDYIDIHEPLCDSMYRKRLKGYAAIGYKITTNSQSGLFDDVKECGDVVSVESIFNGSAFRQPFIADLNKAKRSVISSSPKLYKVARNILVNQLCALVHNGIDVVIMTAAESESSEYLKAKGLPVKIIPTLSLCASIVDKSIVWYGSINALGYISDDDSMIRLENCGLANEFVDELYSEKR